MSKIDIVVDVGSEPRTTVAIPGWNTPIGDSPAEQAERARRFNEATRRGAESHAQWQARHDEWLKENERRRAEARQALVDAGIERFKEERRAACLAVGMTEAAFEKEFPAMLRAAQLQAAESGGLEVERLRASAKYSM